MTQHNLDAEGLDAQKWVELRGLVVPVSETYRRRNGHDWGETDESERT